MKKAITLLLLFFTAISATSQTWEYVGPPGFSDGAVENSIAYAPNGTLYVGYRDSAYDSKCTVMKFNGASWETVGLPGFSPSTAFWFSLKVNSQGTPYVAFWDGDTERVMVMKFNGTSWVYVGPPAGINQFGGDFLSFALDHNDVPYVSFSDWAHNIKLSVMKFNGTSWEYVGEPGFAPSLEGNLYGTSIAIDSEGTPYVAYGFENYSGEWLQANVVKFNGTSWEIVGNQDFSAGGVQSISLTISPNNIPYVAFIDEAYSSKISVMRLNGSFWSYVGPPGLSARAGTEPLITTDPAGTPYLSYTSYTPSLPFGGYVRKFSNGSWQDISSSQIPAGGGNISIAFKEAGWPYIFFGDITNSYRGSVMKLAGPPTTQLQPAYCNSTIAAFNDQIRAISPTTPPTSYRFRVSDGTNTHTIVRPDNMFRMNMVPSYNYNTTYTVNVALNYSGEWGEYGPTCTITTPSVPVTKLNPSDCGITVPAFDTELRANAVQLSEAYRFRVTAGGTTQVVERPNYIFKLNMLPVYDYSTVYTIEVAVQINGQWQDYGPACEVTSPALPAVILRPQDCGVTVPAFNTQLQANGVPLYEAYRFRVSNGGNTQVVEKPNYLFKLNMLPTYNYATTYSVEVAVRVGGQWGTYGPACEVTSPALPTVSLTAEYCGGTVPAFNTQLQANGVPLYEAYRFRATANGNTQVIERPNYLFKINMIPSYSFATTYSIEVAVRINGQWGDYGPACDVSTPGSGMRQNMTQQTEETELSAYPNPFENGFTISMQTASEEPVRIMAFDITGKLLEDRTISVEELSGLAIGQRFASGIYTIVATQGSFSKSFKMVKK